MSPGLVAEARKQHSSTACATHDQKIILENSLLRSNSAWHSAVQGRTGHPRPLWLLVPCSGVMRAGAPGVVERSERSRCCCGPCAGDISIPVSLLRHPGLPPLPLRLSPLPLAFHPVLLKSSQSADFIECGKWQFIKKWEQMGNGLWKKINDAHRPLNRARFGSKHSLHCSL